MQLVPYNGVVVKEYVGEILKNFDKFQAMPSSMKVFTTNLKGPLSPTVLLFSRVTIKCNNLAIIHAPDSPHLDGKIDSWLVCLTMCQQAPQGM